MAEKESKIVLAKLDATEEGAVAEKFEVSAILQTVFFCGETTFCIWLDIKECHHRCEATLPSSSSAMGKLQNMEAAGDSRYMLY